MNVLDAVKILFFGAPGDRNEAAVLVRSEFSRFVGWYVRVKCKIPEDAIPQDDLDDVVQEFVRRNLSRTDRASSHVPESETSARAYLKKAAENECKSLFRRIVLKRSRELLDQGDEEDASNSALDDIECGLAKAHAGETRVVALFAKEPLHAIVTKDNAERVLNHLLQALREWVETNELSASRDVVNPTEDYGKVKKSLIALFCHAVENIFADLRKDAKVGFVEDFQTMLRLAFAFSSYEEEVKKECNMRGIALNKGREDRNYKKVRDTLDQRKHRLLGRLRDALLDVGLSKTEVENIITAFLSRDTEDIIEDV